MTPYHPVVEDLIRLVGSRPELSSALHESIVTAGLDGIKTLPDYYVYLDHLVTLVPSTRPSVVGFSLEFYYIIDCSQGGFLKRDAQYQQWVHDFVAAWGRFLDSPASAENLDRFEKVPGFHVCDYQRGPSGWMSFNQFFARQIKPGLRPIDGLCDDGVVVSPADSVLMAKLPIDADSTVEIKGVHYAIDELLGDSEHRGAFAGGCFTHSLLNTNDYHRFHTPVRGVVKEARILTGSVGIEVTKDADGNLTPSQGDGFEFTQERGLLVLDDTPAGLVAVLPVGMAQISSVAITAVRDHPLRKGEEFGYFQFGGSDIVTLYQAGRVDLSMAREGVHYDQGRQIGVLSPTR